MLIAITLFVFGFNFLKGKDLFNKQTKVFAVYDRVDGLIEANPMLVNGFKVGQVQKIELFHPNDTSDYRVLVTFLINGQVKIPKNSIAKVVSSDLLGSKAVTILFGKSHDYIGDGDTLYSASEDDLKTTVDKRIAPLQKKAENLISSIDSVMLMVQHVLNEKVRENLIQSFESIKNAIISLEHTTVRLDTLVGNEQYAMANIIHKINSITTNIDRNNEKINTIITNFSQISDSLAKVNFKETMAKTNSALTLANNVLNDINSGKGSIGKLLNNDSLYANLNKSAEDLDKLLKDIRINPERYMHVSVFGRRERNKPKN